MVKPRADVKEVPPILGLGVEDPFRMRYRWVMLVLVWLSYCVFGVVSRSAAALVTPIIKDLNISYSQMGLVLGSWPLVYIIVAAIVGGLIDWWGIKKSLFAGIIIIGLSEILRYFAKGFATMFVCVALFGIGGPMISIGCPKTVSLWFSGRDRGTGASIYMTAPWIGWLIAYSATNSVVMPFTGYSWRLTFVCYGLLAFAVALLWWLLARDVESTKPPEIMSIVKVFGVLFRIRNIQIILVIGFFCFAISHGFNDWLPKILETGGLPPATAGFGASIPLLAGVTGLLTIPRLVAPALRGALVALLSLIVAAALLTLGKASGVILIAGLIVYGLSYSPILPITILILMDMPEVGSRYLGSAAGMYFCVAHSGGFVGPFVIGIIKDLTGSFLWGACFLAGLSLAMFAMALSLKLQPLLDTKGP
jgi:cyanate permease